MTTADSFTAQGPAAIGFYANAGVRRGGASSPFKLGALAVGHMAGVYGATDDIALPPTQTIWDEAAVVGTSNNQHGVFGISWTRCGVLGQWGVKPTLLQSPLLPTAAGVMGLAQDADGVVGASDHGTGVTGQSYSSAGISASSVSDIGVDALTEVGGAAIRGQAIAGTGYGVLGMSAGNTGVLGLSGSAGPSIPNPDLPGDAAVMGSSDTAPGVIGTSNAQAGVYGYSAAGDGVVGQSTNYAGFFIGNLLVVNGIKAAAVPFPDGTHRVLYCMESPELWFEDFGTAKLRRGRAVVRLDADFAKVIKRGDYRVFPAPEGDCHGLYVRRKSATSFEVRELMGGKSNVTFSYRIVGRRKDIKGQRRFAQVDALRRVPPRQRAVRSAQRVKTPPRLPARLRALATRMEKEAQAQMSKRARKRKSFAS